jgi:glycosyltransferase involved in cell wall biosynthesis
MAPVKALFVLPDLQGGGAERAVITLLRHFNTRRIEPTLVLLKNEGVYFHEVGRGTRLELILPAKRSLRTSMHVTLPALYRLARQHDVVVGALELVATYMAVIAGRLARKPVVGWIHANLEQYLTGRLKWHTYMVPRLYQNLESIIVPSSGALEESVRVARMPRGRFQVIHNPLDIDLIARKAHQPLGSVFPFPYLLAAGRLSEEKGFGMLLRAYRLLKERGLQHHLVILGEGPLRHDLESLVQKYELVGEVFMPGFVTNPFNVMRNAGIFVLSSEHESFGMVIAEALSLGVPVVSTDCPSGPREILADGKYGLLAVPGDHVDLADKIQLLLNNQSMLRDFATFGKQRAGEFAPAKIAAQWATLIEEVVL